MLCATLLLGLLWGSTGQPAHPDLDACLARPEVIRQLENAVLRNVQEALPDPKREFAGFLPKTGFVLWWKHGRARIEVVENPNTPLLRKLTALHSRDDVAESLLHLCRREEPEQIDKVASYTVKRVLERLEADDETHKLAVGSRRAMSRAIIEELVANTSIDANDQIRDAISGHLARSGDSQQNVLAYGFSIVEYDEPNEQQWQALLADPRLVGFRVFRQGFAVYRIQEQRRLSRFYTAARWPEKIAGALKRWETEHDVAGRPWMGVGDKQTDRVP